MNWILLGTLLAVGALLLGAVPASADPACTCDPNPVTDLVHCALKGDRCDPLVEQLDPRHWPCACDPPPSPF